MKKKKEMLDIMIGAGIIVVVLFFALMGGYFVRGCCRLTDEVSDKGLKAVVEEVWRGPDNGKTP